MTVNISEVFDSLDQRRAAALATIAKYTPEQAAEASRVARLYDRCAETSIKHAEDTVRQLRELFGAPTREASECALNQQQQREASKCAQYCAAGYPDIAARTLSALHRAALRQKQKDAIVAFAMALRVASHPDFVICS
jgi:hypothetical protein